MRKCILSALLMTIAAAPFAHAKGPVDLILISGGGLNQPIEITDSASLHAFTPGQAGLRIGTRRRLPMPHAIADLLRFSST